MDAITKQLAEALRSSLDRMDRARAILTDGRPTPNCNWGVLETMLERTALAAYDIQPLQQARQPLTPREIELIDGMIEVQRHHANQCDTMAARPGGNKVMAEKQKAWDMERIALLEKLKEPPA